MNPQSLHALVIDRHFGELSPEAAELLDHHLAQDPAARDEAERILQSVTVTGEAVLRHPELACVPRSPKPDITHSRRPFVSPWLMRAAALVLLTVSAVAVGFVTGRSGSSAASQSPVLASVSQSSGSTPNSGPWARYRVTYDPTGSGMQVVRVDVPAPETKALR